MIKAIIWVDNMEDTYFAGGPHLINPGEFNILTINNAIIAYICKTF